MDALLHVESGYLSLNTVVTMPRLTFGPYPRQQAYLFEQLLV